MEPNKERGFWGKLFLAPEPIEVRTAVPEDYSGPLPGVIPPSRTEGYASVVSTDQALTIPAVAACVRIINTAVSQLDMTVTRGGSEITSSLVTQPDSNRSAAAFYKRTVTNLTTTGNAYWRLYRNIDGAVVNVECLAPSKVLVRYEDDGTKFYEYNSTRLSNNVPGNNNGQVEHIRLGEFEGHLLGRGPMQINNAALAAILEQRKFYERFLTESKRPSGIYSFKGEPLTAPELAQVDKRIQERVGTGQPLTLNGDVDYQTVMFTAEEAALIEMNKAGVLEVSRIFGVPPYKLASGVEGNSMTYQNIGQADRAWVRESLEEYLTAIEDAMTNVLPRGQVAKFNVENWLRAGEAIAVANQTEKETDTEPVAAQ